MELEIFEALIAANVPADKARNVVESINREIDKRYALHAAQLFTKADGAELKAELQKTISDMQRWTIGAMSAGLAASAAITKLLH